MFSFAASSSSFMNILQLNELTDEMMNLSLNNFYDFIEIELNIDLCELFQVQAIREMSPLSSVIIDKLTQVLTFEIDELKGLKKPLDFTTSDEKFSCSTWSSKIIRTFIIFSTSKENFICQES